MVSLTEVQLDKDALEAVEKFIRFLKKLNETGLMDAIIDLLDPNVIGALTKLFMQPGFLKLLDNIENLGKLIDKINLEKIDSLALLVNSAIEALEKQPKPTGAFGMLFALRNKDAKKGLGIMVELLKALGKNY